MQRSLSGSGVMIIPHRDVVRMLSLRRWESLSCKLFIFFIIQKVEVNGKYVQLDGDQEVKGEIPGGQSPGFWQDWDGAQGDGTALSFQGGILKKKVRF